MIIRRIFLYLYHRLLEPPEASLQTLQARYKTRRLPARWSQCEECGVLVCGAHTCEEKTE